MTTKNKTHARYIEEKPEVRSMDGDTDEKKYIEGYASVFNQKSKLIRDWVGEYYEIIRYGAFTEVLNDRKTDCKATVNHAKDKLLARQKSGTLQLTQDEKGLRYSILKPDTQLGNDTAEMIARGDYFESSFVFTVKPEDVEWDRSAKPATRYINKVSGLFDVSIVTDGYYANTNITIRNIDEEPEASSQKPAASCDILNKQIEILRMKI